MAKKPKSFLAKARSWVAKNNLHGPHGFLRFVSLVFVQRLNKVTDEFIFKGGNLLWVYIKTPRSTVDLDFVTRSLVEHDAVRNVLESACNSPDSNITFSISSFEPIQIQGSQGAFAKICYKTVEGQTNSFDLDIVYAIPSDIIKVLSPLQDDESIHAVTLENIVADKLAAAHRLRSGNSRMKDFDDLWRISRVTPNLIDWPRLQNILAQRALLPILNPLWVVPQMERAWQSHVKRNRDLPNDLPTVMREVNFWLQSYLRGSA